MKNIKIYSLLFLIIMLSSCEQEMESPNPGYASLESYLSDITVSPGGELSKSVKVFTRSVTGQDRIIELDIETNLEAGAYVAPRSVTIPANSNQATIDMIFKDINLSLAVDKTFKISLLKNQEFLSTGESRTMLVAKGCGAGTKKLKIAVTLDAYPEEVYWRIVNLATNTIVLTNKAVPGFGGYAGLTGVRRDAVCLSPGQYRFQVFDQYGDGAGAISISVNGATIITSNGRYAAGFIQDFTIN